MAMKLTNWLIETINFAPCFYSREAKRSLVCNKQLKTTGLFYNFHWNIAKDKALLQIMISYQVLVQVIWHEMLAWTVQNHVWRLFIFILRFAHKNKPTWAIQAQDSQWSLFYPLKYDKWKAASVESHSLHAILQSAVVCQYGGAWP